MTKNYTLKFILLVFSVCVAIAICCFTLYFQHEAKPKILAEMRLEVLKTTPQSLRHIATMETTTTMAPFTKKEDKRVTEKNIDKQQARRSLLIFGQDRTGTTFLSAMFAQDPQMFIVYEPLWITKGWRSNEPNYNCSGCEIEIVNAILSCNFSRYPSSTKLLWYVKTAWTGALPVNIFTTNHFCNSSGQRKADCSKMRENPNFVDRVCKENFKHSVVKVSPSGFLERNWLILSRRLYWKIREPKCGFCTWSGTREEISIPELTSNGRRITRILCLQVMLGDFAKRR